MRQKIHLIDAGPGAEGRQLSEVKREQIMSAARRVFLEEGFDGASMQRITELSGVSKATVYNHFPGKDRLFEAVMLEQVRKLRDNTFTLLTGLDKPQDVLFGLGVGLVSGILQPQNLKIARQLVSDGWRFPHLGRAFMAEGPNRGAELLASYLQDLCAQGVLRIDDPVLAAHQFVALAEAGQANEAHMTGELPSQDEIASRVRSAVKVFMRGYAPG
ncbi:MAG: TetR/AcrR family transcriptional regulator [Curvibacter sp.]|nr:MAG: TetR/AcrR family transcriptional regulator [Curvibacter sp.]